MVPMAPERCRKGDAILVGVCARQCMGTSTVGSPCVTCCSSSDGWGSRKSRRSRLLLLVWKAAAAVVAAAWARVQVPARTAGSQQATRFPARANMHVLRLPEPSTAQAAAGCDSVLLACSS